MADLDEKMAKVMKGFTSLLPSQRDELFKLMEKYQNKVLERDIILEQVSKGVSLGPTSYGSCPCCGK